MSRSQRAGPDCSVVVVVIGAGRETERCGPLESREINFLLSLQFFWVSVFLSFGNPQHELASGPGAEGGSECDVVVVVLAPALEVEW